MLLINLIALWVATQLRHFQIIAASSLIRIALIISLMGYKCINISLHQTISYKISPKVGKAERWSTNNYNRWTEKSSSKGNEKCQS